MLHIYLSNSWEGLILIVEKNMKRHKTRSFFKKNTKCLQKNWNLRPWAFINLIIILDEKPVANVFLKHVNVRKKSTQNLMILNQGKQVETLPTEGEARSSLIISEVSCRPEINEVKKINFI